MALGYQGNITGRGFGGETMRGARPRDWQTDPSDMDWNAFGNPMQDRMAPDLSGENPNYIQDSRKYIGDERYDEEDPRELAAWYREMADKGLEIPQNREMEEPIRTSAETAAYYKDLADKGIGLPQNWNEPRADMRRLFRNQEDQYRDELLAKGEGPIPSDVTLRRLEDDEMLPTMKDTPGWFQQETPIQRLKAAAAMEEDPEMMRRESYPNNRFGKYREE